ncbi:DUF5916 domain-containing protein [Aquimarina sp. I32.4]|uniref:DUF5916 domain-containing protein n=1 Tax=Aquimarina sp. I32.4 TaxID=2053903 RepID=UPI000CDEA404|nr:DUF5916 domain-containing protein [Aquimarina sp. I32.4]
MKKWICNILVFVQYNMIAQQTNQNFPPPDTPPQIHAKRVQGTIKIDGKLTESDWQNAIPVDDFFRMEPRQGGTYKHKTEVKVLFDEKYLYVGVFCEDSLGQKGVRVQDLRRDFSEGENDIFSIQLDPQNLKQYCVSFQTTPYGNQRDLQNFNDTTIDNDWNALWSVRTHRTDKGYFAEFGIPFASLRYDNQEKGEDVAWGITFNRLARRDYERTVFPAIPQSFSQYRMTYAAQIKGLELPDSGVNLRIEPYSLYKYTTTDIEGEENSESDIKFGGDLKWAISPQSVLDVTVNTDFAQADVDRAVNNLERFNIFFPERRQFFLENSGIWAGASSELVRPFFSRKIGLEGRFNAVPAPIDVGTRFTDRNDKRTLAGLYIHQRETDNSPGANFGVFRYSQNYSKENNIGIMINHRLDEKNNVLAVDQNNNTTTTIDGLIRLKDKWTISYLASATYDEQTSKWGQAGSIFSEYSSNRMKWGWSTDFVSKEYDSKTGFVFQNDVIRHNPGGYFILRPKKLPWIRRWDPGFFARYQHDFQNPEEFQQASLYLFPVYIFFKDNSFVEYSVTPSWQNINFDFEPLGLSIEKKRYFYTRQFVRYNSDRSRKLSASAKYEWGDFYNGNRKTVTAGIRYAPLPHVAITGDYEHNSLKNIGVQREGLKTDLYSASLRLALSPRMQVSSFYQYNSFDKRGGWNARLSWEYMPLSFIYLVFNDTQINSFDPVQRNQQFISKITFLKQF